MYQRSWTQFLCENHIRMQARAGRRKYQLTNEFGDSDFDNDVGVTVAENDSAHTSECIRIDGRVDFCYLGFYFWM